MEKHKEKIRKFSKTAYVALQTAFVILIAAGIFEAFAWLVRVGKIPAIFQFGGITVTTPAFFTEGIAIGGSTFQFGIVELVRTIMTIVIVGMTKSIFKKLRVDGTPFRGEIVEGLKAVSITLLFAGVFAGLDSFFSAGVVWVVCMIFDYGCALQNESDTTL